MKELYRVEGTLNQGFVGQITYMVCLDKPCSELDIHLTYDYAELRYQDEKMTPEEVIKVYGTEERRRRHPEITPEVYRDTIEAVRVMCDCEIDEERARHILIYDIDLKTEIHPLAMLNDEFIGCIHKQLPDRHMIFQGDYASEGCIPQERFEGVLKVTLLVFNVAKDNTHYTLTVSGK